jgi:hypothetical protein
MVPTHTVFEGASDAGQTNFKQCSCTDADEGASIADDDSDNVVVILAVLYGVWGVGASNARGVGTLVSVWAAEVRVLEVPAT